MKYIKCNLRTISLKEINDKVRRSIFECSRTTENFYKPILDGYDFPGMTEDDVNNAKVLKSMGWPKTKDISFQEIQTNIKLAFSAFKCYVEMDYSNLKITICCPFGTTRKERIFFIWDISTKAISKFGLYEGRRLKDSWNYNREGSNEVINF